ncbi:MAG TPA: hypothetical protein VGF60_18015 [Xanthobacteraceae bacterium]|jgi:hypothetical protein
MKTSAAVAGFEALPDGDHGSGTEMRPALLRALTDLYLQRLTHTPEDEHYFTELALRLIEAIDIPARAALAERLAAYPSAPRPVMERLASDVSEVAAPILRHATVPGESGRGQSAVRAAAQPGPVEMPPAPERPNPACIDDFGASEGADASELADLFHAAASLERRLILANLDYSPLPTATLPMRMQPGDFRRLERTVLQHDTEALARELEHALGISRMHARRITTDRQGELIIVAAKALELPRDMLERMLLLMSSGDRSSLPRVAELSRLCGEISFAAACRLIGIWQEADRSARPHCQPPTASRRTAAENAGPAQSEPCRRPARLRREDGRRRSDDKARMRTAS